MYLIKVGLKFGRMLKETKRDRFFSKTLVLIYQKGFKATTMRDIAQNLNFEVANVYNYIDSKQSFLEQALFGIQQEFLNAMDAIEDSEFHATEKLEHLIRSYVQITSKRPYEQALLVNEWRNLNEPKLQEFVKHREDYEQKLEGILIEGMRTGQFKEMDSQMATQIILATLRWSYKQFLDQQRTTNPLAMQKQLIDFIQNGIVLK